MMALVLAPAQASVIISHVGSTDPGTEGFGGTGTAVTGAWNISGSWCCSYDRSGLSGGEIAELDAAPYVDLTATFANLAPGLGGSGGYGPETGGSNAAFSYDGIRFDLNLVSDGSGDQVLSLDPFAGGPAYTIAGLGTGYVTLDLILDNSTHLADAYVNGTLVISGFGGHTYYTGNFVNMGSADGDFSFLQLQTEDAPNLGSAPEPGSLCLMAAAGVALAGMRGLRRR